MAQFIKTAELLLDIADINNEIYISGCLYIKLTFCEYVYGIIMRGHREHYVVPQL